MVWLGVAVCSTIGSLIPMLWGGSMFGGWSLFLSVVGAFVGLDGRHEGADMAPRVFDGSLLGSPHPVFDLGEGLLDRIEVWRVGRQEE